MMTFDQSGMDGMHSRLTRFTRAVENPSPLLQGLATELAEMWKSNILAGPNERWEAGLSIRAREQSGTTLYDTGMMLQSITGQQVEADAIAIGSALTVGNGWNLLSIHEFGADVIAHTPAGLRFQLPFTRTTFKRDAGKSLKNPVSGSTWVTKMQVRIPARPTSPFDWPNQTLLPPADELVRNRVGDYMVEAAKP